MKNYKEINRNLEKKRERSNQKNDSAFIDELKEFSELVKKEKKHDLDYKNENNEMSSLGQSSSSQHQNESDSKSESEEITGFSSSSASERNQRAKQKLNSLRRSSATSPKKNLNDDLEKAMREVMDSLSENKNKNQNQVERDDDDER